MQTANFSCKLSANRDNDFRVEILLDGEKIFAGTAQTEVKNISHDFQDVESCRTLEIKLSGKTSDHTVVDEQDNIVKDTTIQIKDIELDNINIDQIVWEKAEYCHDYNGNGDRTVDKFYGEMGCNGTVSLKFTTPIYLWLLENM